MVLVLVIIIFIFFKSFNHGYHIGHNLAHNDKSATNTMAIVFIMVIVRGGGVSLMISVTVMVTQQS